MTDPLLPSHDPVTSPGVTAGAWSTARPLSRRVTLVGGLAATAVASVAAAPDAEAGPRPLQGAEVHVGVLLARGLGANGSGTRLVQGFRIGATRAGMRIELHHREVGVGPGEARRGAEKLIAAGAKVLVAAVATPVLDQVADLCREKKVALVVANTGAQVAVTRLDGALVNSLQLWQAGYAAGSWASRRMGRSLFTVVAAPDAGYDSVYAFTRGFTSSGGRELGRALTHQATPGVEEAARAARDSGAAVVRVHAYGRRATDIVTACRKVGVQAQIVVDPLTLEPKAGSRSVLAKARVWTASSWLPAGENSLARALARTWKRRHGGRPDAFALLGFDTALLVAEGVRRARRKKKKLHTIPTLMRSARVKGARGTQVVDPQSRVVSTPLAVRRSRRSDVAGSRREAALARVQGNTPALVTAARGATSIYHNEYTTT